MRKKVLYVLFVELFLSSVCQAKHITADSAAIVAEKFLVSRGVSKNKLALRKFTTSGSAHVRSQSAAAPAYHVFTMTGEEGFVIVSGDDIAKPILGYSQSGTIVVLPMP